jgi:DNA helicase MCM8
MYARRECNPKIGDEAASVLTDFYVNLRQTHKKSIGHTPVTMRQLESLQRLTQARAKVDMRSECSASDAREVIEILKSSMVDHYENDLSLLEQTKTSSGTI